MATYDWTCPFCGRDTTITDNDIKRDYAQLDIKNSIGTCRLFVTFIVCPNSQCKKYTLDTVLRETKLVGTSYEYGNILHQWSLIPASDAKVFPDYVPAIIRADYAEACAIKKMSPKASATLARRCLQGMIRDFWGISKARLIDEIDAIKDKVDSLTWQAIDAVRRVGNISAHMEKDINVIIDVDPNEAAQLIGLIEILLKDWYITRHERQERLTAIAALANAKQAAKTP